MAVESKPRVVVLHASRARRAAAGAYLCGGLECCRLVSMCSACARVNFGASSSSSRACCQLLARPLPSR
jgi:hypothetical protein